MNIYTRDNIRSGGSGESTTVINVNYLFFFHKNTAIEDESGGALWVTIDTRVLLNFMKK